jgi:hypothetical protein
MDTNFMILHRAVFAAPVGTMGLWAGGNEFGGYGAVTTYVTEPEPLEVILRLASMFAGAVAIFFIFPVAATVMFAVTAMVVFALVR